MEMTRMYACLCDGTRLRVLHLLSFGPLCVCHFQEVLKESQVKISKHLRFLRNHGLVEVRRDANWMIYSLPKKLPKPLKAHLACLKECRAEEPALRTDLERLERLRAKFETSSPICGLPARSSAAVSRR